MYSPNDCYPFDYEEPDPPITYTSEDGGTVLVLNGTTLTLIDATKPITEDGPDAEDFDFNDPISKLFEAIVQQGSDILVLLYRDDKKQRLLFDMPRAYRQRPATDVDRAEFVSRDGWVDEHLEIVDADEGATIADLFEAE